VGPDPSGKNTFLRAALISSRHQQLARQVVRGAGANSTAPYGGGAGRSRVLGIVGAAMLREVLPAAR
jgi:hypothetical protein